MVDSVRVGTWPAKGPSEPRGELSTSPMESWGAV